MHAVELTEALRAAGGRLTGPRVEVLQVLTDAGHGHLSALEIHRRGLERQPAWDLSTVYRTLTRLEELGLVHAVPVGGEMRYARADGRHLHAICTRCGRIEEPSGPEVEAVLDRLAAATGMDLAASGVVTLNGICRSCRARPGGREAPA